MHGEDKLLINEIKQGNQAVFEKLFHQYYGHLSHFANQYLLNKDASEDIVQGVFIYLWENSDDIQIEKSIRSYLFQSVKNRCLNHLRSLKIWDKHQVLYLEALLSTYEENIDAESGILAEIKKALQLLPEQMNEVFCKKYIEELSIKEIASDLSISENTVKVQLFKGRNKIRELLVNTVGCHFFL